MAYEYQPGETVLLKGKGKRKKWKLIRYIETPAGDKGWEMINPRGQHCFFRTDRIKGRTKP